MSTLKVQRGPWKLDLDYRGEALHVRPRNDARWHPIAEDCHCIPTTDVVEMRDCEGLPVHMPVYFHTALDGREVAPPPLGVVTRQEG